jgi:hypothetical protein
MAPGDFFVAPAGSELPAMTERVFLTAEEFEIPTPAKTSSATTVIKRTLWERMSVNSKLDVA